jgi:hypothetical protein
VTDSNLKPALARIQEVARLRSIVFLLHEAQRIAIEGDHTLITAKISEMQDILEALDR